jgi:RimJ/RimL family protein N-acetyltransferase/anti-anti-sigma regulatory factor
MSAILSALRSAERAMAAEVADVETFDAVAVGRLPLAVSAALRVDFTVEHAERICRFVRDLIDKQPSFIRLDLRNVTRVDVVGLAALLQAAAYAARQGVRLAVVPSGRLRSGLLEAHLLEDIDLETVSTLAPRRSMASPGDDGAEPSAVLASSGRLTLRLPRREDLERFGRWAADPLLTQMVGSDLLYRCRHLGHEDPGVAASILDSVTSLIALVAPRDRPDEVCGFVRLYDIRLSSGFAFAETAIADPQACRRGWGVEASRLLLAYAMDVLELHRVEAKVFRYNALSINALRRNGFREEGVLREAHVFDGQRWDLLVFSILEPEMVAQRNQREQFPYMGFWRTV